MGQAATQAMSQLQQNLQQIAVGGQNSNVHGSGNTVTQNQNVNIKPGDIGGSLTGGQTSEQTSTGFMTYVIIIVVFVVFIALIYVGYKMFGGKKEGDALVINAIPPSTPQQSRLAGPAPATPTAATPVEVV